MAVIHHSEPFPADIDRKEFGHWLSGFSDGEGCFQLEVESNRSKCNFSIGLRLDDLDILKLIQSYFGCGAIYAYGRVSCGDGSNPYARFECGNPADAVANIIPHFDKFPMRAYNAPDIEVAERKQPPPGSGQRLLFDDPE